MYDHALARVREVKDNDEARRAEAELLAGSAYALRRLNRIDEAKDRIDTALRLLAQIHDYPAAIVVADEAAEVVLRSLGDHLADTGKIRQAAETYEDVLRKMTSSAFDVNSNLSQAVALSRIYTALARVHRRGGEWDRAMQVDRMHAELWERWYRMLPNNAFVRGRLESAGSHSKPANVLSRFPFKYREGQKIFSFSKEKNRDNPTHTADCRRRCRELDLCCLRTDIARNHHTAVCAIRPSGTRGQRRLFGRLSHRHTELCLFAVRRGSSLDFHCAAGHVAFYV